LEPKPDAASALVEAPTQSLITANLPVWFPGWARRLGELYFSGTTSVFVLTGNVYDLLPMDNTDAPPYGGLTRFLAEQVFGRWDLVLHYDLAHGLRAFAGANEGRLKEMVTTATKVVGDMSAVRDPGAALDALDRFVANTIMAKPEQRLRTAVIVNHASYLFPASEPGRLSTPASRMLITVLNWATSPHVKHVNLACMLVNERRTDFSDRLVGNPHVAAIEIPLPDEQQRERYIRTVVAADELDDFSEYDAGELARLTAGVACTDLNVLLRSSRTSGARLDAKVFQQLKKDLLEKQCQGLLEFVQPKWGLDTVVGHEAAKARLREDTQLLERGQLDSLPMGYLLCGAVGTGKTFLAQCAAGEIGIPCVVLKNFRSKYVGETEGNLERVLSVLRAMGPVMVIIDEADAALGDREASGDSGTSSRVFAMIATQMGDTRYRGRILWMLVTARPDLLPIDIKRQGRAEVHIPLFYPTDEEEIKELFVVLARKFGTSIRKEDIPAIPQKGFLSGADVEGLVGRARRRSLLQGSNDVLPDVLAEVINQFMPSTEGLEKELQETAAIIECTDRQFLPEAIAKRLAKAGGRMQLQERLNELKRMGL
jgi:AAA+ superfamily predicted ATPase